MQSNSIHLALFDMAGTTVHDEQFVAKTLCKALGEHGYEAVTLDAANAVMGIAKPVAIKLLLEQFYPEAAAAADIVRIHQSFLNAMIDFYEHAPGIREMEGATDTFLRLKEMGIKVGLDTGFSRDITDIIIERLGWHKPGILDVSVASDEVAQGRPHPDMVYKAMALLDITDVKKVAKIGDTPVDLQEGSNAACGLVIGVLSGAADRSTLEQYPHTHLASSINEVPDMIRDFTFAEA
ncbi:HAD hydrolase-like protein [Taibaiella koreensis]|uniref:HAD hydrolase-like protein n=1 Tax=Taibaiella koreensis TaxID=1268548 RepID=UPI000E5A06A1|nr:HAD hydrolase-like protein [Taibaiella koreensis]